MRLPIGSWSRSGSGPVAPQLFAAPAGLRLAGVFLTIIGDHQDPEFSMASLKGWIERVEEAIGPDADLIFTTHQGPGPSYALASAFFGP
jgi:hypothetical protein